MKKVRRSAKRETRVSSTTTQVVEHIPFLDSVVIEHDPPPIPRIPTPVPVVIERVPTPILSAIRSALILPTFKVIEIHIGAYSTTLTMIFTWFKPENVESALNGIVHSLDVSEKSTETLVLSLEDFAQQFGDQVSFTIRDLSFESSAENAACGVPNLGSVHLLANDNVPTAKFTFYIDLDYDQQLACLKGEDEQFCHQFFGCYWSSAWMQDRLRSCVFD